MIGAAVLSTIALTTAWAGPATARDTVGITICPPTVVKIGTPLNVQLFDAENGSGFQTVISEGALPDGLVVTPNTGNASHIVGTPSKVGAFAFTMSFSSDWGQPSSRKCWVDIVPTTSILDRVDGEDRYFTAAHASRRFAPDKAPLVYVASGENYPDALSAAAIAAQHGAPLVLAMKNEVPNYVYNNISSWEPSNVVVVGGVNALTDRVKASLETLRSKPTVTRIGGADRYEVSRNLIAHPTFGAVASSSVFIATGQRFPDALSATPPAAKLPAPVLLVDGGAGALTSAEKALLTARGVTGAMLLGGEDTVSAGIANDLKSLSASVARLEGHDRFATSAKIVAANYTAPVDTVYLATGENFPDALAGGVLAGVTKSPVLLTHKSCVATEVAAEVRRLAPKHLVLLGGAAVLDANLENLPICP
jgi:putative cell wall-binding protein